MYGASSCKLPVLISGIGLMKMVTMLIAGWQLITGNGIMTQEVGGMAMALEPILKDSG